MDTNNKKTGLIKIPGALTSTGYEDGIAGIVAYAGDIYDYDFSKNQSEINKQTVSGFSNVSTKVNNLQNTVANIQAYNIGDTPTAGLIGLAVGTGLEATDIQQAIYELAQRTDSIQNFEGYATNAAENNGIANYNSYLVEQKINALISCIQELITIIVFHSGTPYQLPLQLTQSLSLLRQNSINTNSSTASICGDALCGCAICGLYTGSKCGQAVCGDTICGKN